MSYWFDAPLARRDVIKIPTFWIAIALSILIHIAVLWQWLPHMRTAGPEKSERMETPLTVHLVPPPSPPSRAAPMPETRQPKIAMRPPKAERPRPAPPVIAPRESARTQPAPSTPPTIAAPVPAPAPARPQVEGDFASYVEARRRARGESAAPAPAQPAEDENARASRRAAANLATQRPQAFGYDPSKAGGVFEITRISYDYAEFMFYGWNRDIRRNTSQLIEVRKGGSATIQLAVVRKMIEIIRSYEQNDFRWESERLGRTLLLSARARDNEGLEDFMMHEFFGNPR